MVHNLVMHGAHLSVESRIVVLWSVVHDPTPVDN